MKLKHIVALLSFGIVLLFVEYVWLSSSILANAMLKDEDGNNYGVADIHMLKQSARGGRNNLHPSSHSREKRLVTAQSLLNDQTLDWDPMVNREWLISHKNQQTKQPPPPAMLLLTTYGWNHGNQTFGRQVFRNIRTRELVNGIINHPWFHPTAWQDINSGQMKLSNSTRYYVFLDKHTCGEKNYPKYGKGLEGVFLNRDEWHGRGRCCLEQKNHFTSHVMDSKVMTSENAIFVLFDCTGVGPVRKPEFKRDRRRYPGNKLAFVSVSAVRSDLHPDHDQGLVPPALLSCAADTTSTSVIRAQDSSSCKPRPILLSFAGKIMRAASRRDLETISNGKNVLVGGWEKSPKWMNMAANETARAFLKLASLSSFGATPRGDNLFSYRLTETMSCGAIPVVYADDWKLPFGDRLVNWSSLAIRIPESQANQSLQILEKLSNDEICTMRERVKIFYDKYMRDGTAVIRGIVENFELKALSK